MVVTSVVVVVVVPGVTSAHNPISGSIDSTIIIVANHDITSIPGIIKASGQPGNSIIHASR